MNWKVLTNQRISIGEWTLDAESSTLIHQKTQESKELSWHLVRLLLVLIHHADTAVSRSTLVTQVWQGRVVGSSSLPVAIHTLRRMLQDTGRRPKIITTVAGHGYCFKGEVSVQPPLASQAQPLAVPPASPQLASLSPRQGAEFNDSGLSDCCSNCGNVRRVCDFDLSKATREVAEARQLPERGFFTRLGLALKLLMAN